MTSFDFIQDGLNERVVFLVGNISRAKARAARSIYAGAKARTARSMYAGQNLSG
jgi:hypothetical protein